MSKPRRNSKPDQHSDIPPAINVHRLQLQFDADQVTHGTPEQQAEKAIELINALLQREPFGLGAQLISHRDEIEVEKVDRD